MLYVTENGEPWSLSKSERLEVILVEFDLQMNMIFQTFWVPGF